MMCGVQTKSISIEEKSSLAYILIDLYNYNKQTYTLMASKSTKVLKEKKGEIRYRYIK